MWYSGINITCHYTALEISKLEQKYEIIHYISRCFTIIFSIQSLDHHFIFLHKNTFIPSLFKNREMANNINPYREWLESWPDPSTISAETMQVAEEIAWKEVLYKIHPTMDEDEKRADITRFLQTLITHSFPEVEVIFITFILLFYCSLQIYNYIYFRYPSNLYFKYK